MISVLHVISICKSLRLSANTSVLSAYLILFRSLSKPSYSSKTGLNMRSEQTFNSIGESMQPDHIPHSVEIASINWLSTFILAVSFIVNIIDDSQILIVSVYTEYLLKLYKAYACLDSKKCSPYTWSIGNPNCVRVRFIIPCELFLRTSSVGALWDL